MHIRDESEWRAMYGACNYGYVYSYFMHSNFVITSIKNYSNAILILYNEAISVQSVRGKKPQLHPTPQRRKFRNADE